MFNSVSHWQRQTASWSIELKAFSKSRYARKSGAPPRAAPSIAKWRDCTCLCHEAVCSAGAGTPPERGLEARVARRCGTAGRLRSRLVSCMSC